MDRIRSEWYWARYRAREWRHDTVPRVIAWVLPRRIVYHAVIRAWVFSQSGRHATEHPTDVRTFETAERWRLQDH